AGTESATPIATGLTTLSYTDFGMTVGNRYYYKVAAVNNAGISAMSSEVSAVPPGSNIAPSGTGYLWAKNTTATSNSNQTASTGVNDSNLTTSVNVCPDGEAGAVKWEGAGVVWSAATHTITSASFINGANDGGGNGYLQASCQLQFTTDGTTWTSSGWTCSPAYPNSSSAFSQTYTFSGTPATGVKGARIVGATGSSSWRWQVKEVQFTGL
ncbi:MAG: exoglucanase, partial [Capsulimonas sp.]|nr:exoglucanase [Capsulimonas sp.]